MAKDHLYAVSFHREANNMIDWFVYHCWAQNASEAKILTRRAWETRYRAQRAKKIPHMFWLEAHRTESQNIDDLLVKNWLGKERVGADAMWSFVMTQSNHRGKRGW